MAKYRVGFFGSDQFSIRSLTRLVGLQKERPDLLHSIEVITRPPKRFRKEIIDVPIASAAKGINVHRVDSRQDMMNLLERTNFNLVIAVSFGKLIPAKFLQATQFGGLNVHPSLLPKYSGASPIQFALLNDDTETGVSVQTLHPTMFDHGDILLQQDAVSITDADNSATLMNRLGDIGGELLVQTIEKELFLKDHKIVTEYEYSYAPKLKKEEHKIIWDNYIGRHIFKRFCALGPLFTYVYCDIYSKAQKKNLQSFKRVLFDDIKEQKQAPLLNLAPGEFCLDEESDRLIVKAARDSYISVGSLLMETYKKETPTEFMTRLKKRTGSLESKFITL